MKDLIEKYKKIKQNPKGNAYLFFAFYFVFFAVLISTLNLSSRKNANFEQQEKENVSYLEIGELKKYNYQFQYIVSLDGVEKQYNGKKNNNRELFSFQNKDYYYDGKEYYVKDAAEGWIITRNPYLYKDFLNISSIMSFFQESFLESETSYKSGKKSYRFFLDTNVIYQIINGQETDYEDDGNLVIVNTFDDQIESINFQLNGYCKSQPSCNKDLTIKIVFEKVGEIEDFSNPTYS